MLLSVFWYHLNKLKFYGCLISVISRWSHQGINVVFYGLQAPLKLSFYETIIKSHFSRKLFNFLRRQLLTGSLIEKLKTVKVPKESLAPNLRESEETWKGSWNTWQPRHCKEPRHAGLEGKKYINLDFLFFFSFLEKQIDKDINARIHQSIIWRFLKLHVLSESQCLISHWIYPSSVSVLNLFESIYTLLVWKTNKNLFVFHVLPHDSLSASCNIHF